MTCDAVLPQKVLPRRDGLAPDALVGATSVIVRSLGHAGHLVVRFSGPGARLILDPPFVPSTRRPVRLVEALARRGRLERAAGRTLDHLVAAVVPDLVDHLVKVVGLTELIRHNVDLDVLVAGVDLEAVVNRIDVDAIIDRIDVDAIIDRIDLDAIIERIDLDAIIERIDLDALANQVIAAVDLPGIIRESSGSLASETVRSVRMQSIDADRAVERAIDRLRDRRHLRRGGRLPGSAAT